MTRYAWLQQLKVGDTVVPYFDSGRMAAEIVTSAPPTFVTVGKYRHRVSFRRCDGFMCGQKPLSHRFRIEKP